MCTIIVTIRSVLWAVMTLSAALMILVSMLTSQWLEGPGLLPTASSSLGLFGGPSACRPLAESSLMLFEGECIPDLDVLRKELLSEEEGVIPHAWKGGIACLTAGLLVLLLTVLLSLLSPCWRHCCCCSTFTLSGSLQSFSAVLFTLGLLAYPAGWGGQQVQDICGASGSFVLGSCKIGGAYWMAVAGTVCTFLASSLSVFAYRSTRSHKTQYRRQEGETFICVP